jgi:hypothetical protein
VFLPNEGARGTWKDVTYLALLETEWLMRGYRKPAPRNLWDEMFARHAREREELLRWDERQQKLKKTSSMETVRVASTADDEAVDPAVAFMSGTNAPVPTNKGKRRRLDPDPLEHLSPVSSPPPSESESEQSNASWDMGACESDDASGYIRLPSSAHISRTPMDSDSSSEYSSNFDQSSRISVSPVPSGSPSSPNWDMLETSSVYSSSFESLTDSDHDE